MERLESLRGAWDRNPQLSANYQDHPAGGPYVVGSLLLTHWTIHLRSSC